MLDGHASAAYEGLCILAAMRSWWAKIVRNTFDFEKFSEGQVLEGAGRLATSTDAFPQLDCACEQAIQECHVVPGSGILSVDCNVAQVYHLIYSTARPELFHSRAICEVLIACHFLCYQQVILSYLCCEMPRILRTCWSADSHLCSADNKIGTSEVHHSVCQDGMTSEECRAHFA